MDVPHATSLRVIHQTNYKQLSTQDMTRHKPAGDEFTLEVPIGITV